MPIAGYHSAGVEGPNASARCGVSDKGATAKVELRAGKIIGELGYVQAALNPNLTTGGSVGPDGVEARVGGMGATVGKGGVHVHTPIGSLGFRF